MGGVTDLRTVSNCDLDAAGILHRCQWGVPVNCQLDAAIEASLKSFDPWKDHRTSAHAVRAVFMAMTPTIDVLIKQMRYIDCLPDMVFNDLPTGTQKQMVATIKREIEMRRGLK